jgi:hypothetical protein
MIAQEKRIKMMFLRPKPGISTNTHKCHLSGRAFPKFCTSALYLFVWLTTSPFLIQIFIPLSPTHAHSLLYFFLSFSSFLFPLFLAQQLLLPIFFSFSSLPSPLPHTAVPPLFQHAIPSPFFLLFHFLPLLVSLPCKHTHTSP